MIIKKLYLWNITDSHLSVFKRIQELLLILKFYNQDYGFINIIRLSLEK